MEISGVPKDQERLWKWRRKSGRQKKNLIWLFDSGRSISVLFPIWQCIRSLGFLIKIHILWYQPRPPGWKLSFLIWMFDRLHRWLLIPTKAWEQLNKKKTERLAGSWEKQKGTLIQCEYVFSKGNSNHEMLHGKCFFVQINEMVEFQWLIYTRSSHSMWLRGNCHLNYNKNIFIHFV
jgi:hypothetical protein